MAGSATNAIVYGRCFGAPGYSARAVTAGPETTWTGTASLVQPAARSRTSVRPVGTAAGNSDTNTQWGRTRSGTTVIVVAGPSKTSSASAGIPAPVTL